MMTQFPGVHRRHVLSDMQSNCQNLRSKFGRCMFVTQNNIYIYENVFKTTRSFRYQWFRVSTLQANATKHGKINFKPMNRS